MDMQSKLRMIDQTLGFLLDGPFAETARDFPSPQDIIEDWYLHARIFAAVRDQQGIAEEHWQALDLLIEDAIAEYEAARMLGEAPDTEEELGVGYDGYEVPTDFAANHQAVIWQQVVAVLGSDTRPPALTIESIED